MKMRLKMGTMHLICILFCVLGTSAVEPHRDLKHPMLFFTDKDITQMRQKARTSHVHIMKDLLYASKDVIGHSEQTMTPATQEKFSESWNEVYSANLPLLALYYILGDHDVQAKNYLIESMDRLVGFRSWRVKDMESEDTPIALTLIGFVTAFDFIYEHLDVNRREVYKDKIVAMTAELHALSGKRWWGRALMHSNAMTNNVALFFGCLICRVHDKKTSPWMFTVVVQLESNIDLLRNVIDGSYYEGLSYATSFMKYLSQYMWLAKQHLAKDHSQHPWLRQHFNFYYHTILPGYSGTLGIADSDLFWTYGPESILVFLDSFSMRTGGGNWLAGQTRRHWKLHMRTGMGKKYSMLHTRFLWYNASLGDRAPEEETTVRMHDFSDWGVVTYYTGSLDSSHTSFSSFKSGYPRGQGITRVTAKLRLSPSTISAGHVHPDQNSFTLSLTGNTIVSEGYNGPKFSYLNNVLMFANGSSKSSDSWIGQLGEGNNWFTYKNLEVANSFGRILRASRETWGFIAVGESRAAYPASLKLKHVRRFLLHLHSDIAVVIDDVETLPGSPVDHVSAFLNNRFNEYVLQHHSKLSLDGAFIKCKDQTYSVWWQGGNMKSPVVHLRNITYRGTGLMTLSNLNITYQIEKQKYMIYVFHNSKTMLTKLESSGASPSLNIDMSFENNEKYNIQLDKLTVNVKVEEMVKKNRTEDAETEVRNELYSEFSYNNFVSLEMKPVGSFHTSFAYCAAILLVIAYNIKKKCCMKATFRMRVINIIVVIILVIWGFI